MDSKDVQSILNETARTIFKKNIDVDFRINNENQIILNIPSMSSLYHLKNRIVGRVRSKEIIDVIRINPTHTICSREIINLLKDIVKNEFDLNNILDIRIDISDNILNKAKKLLEEHIEDVKEFYINPIIEMVDVTNIDRFVINEIWKKEVLPKYNVVNKIDSFKTYSTIKQYYNYPYLILECKTGSISLAESTTENFLKVKNNEDELFKIKETERILSKCYKNIKPFVKIEEIIHKNEILNSSLLFNEDSRRINCSNFYYNQINKRLKVDLISGGLILDSMVYNLVSTDLNKAEDIIDNIYSEVAKETEEYINNEIQKRKDRFNQPHMYDILNVINDFPKKGITTYASILIGENSSKIKSNDYDKSLSYGKMSEFTNSYITNKIRDCIAQGFIEENRYKASFGRYIGLTLSGESKDYINNSSLDNNILNDYVEKEEINCFNTLLNRLRASSSLRAKILLMKTSEASIPFIKSDFDILLNFIENNRNIYREYEDIFNQCISKIVPIKYKPLFLLNSNFASGVNKKTLKSIYEHMEKIEEKL